MFLTFPGHGWPQGVKSENETGKRQEETKKRGISLPQASPFFTINHKKAWSGTPDVIVMSYTSICYYKIAEIPLHQL
jgi:hypothetical protein